jgi:D-alanine--D-alanine ligase
MNKAFIGRVGVLAGGPSNEREISLKSGRAVHSALIAEGVDAIFLDVWDDIYDIIRNARVDVMFIALHGRFGEDGTVQKMLEELRIPYTGSGVAASRVALDKVESRGIFIKDGIPVPRYAVFDKTCYDISRAGAFGMPVVVKPSLEGSSIGLSIVPDRLHLPAAVEKAFAYGDRILVEEFIDGREFTVGILEDRPLPVVEIVTSGNVYDYAAKYSDPQTRYLVPAPLDEALYKEAQELGRRSHAALGCRDFSRVDMRMNRKNEFFVLEVNTIPGMTERSLLPKAAQSMGLDFGRLCVRLVRNALRDKSEVPTR